MAISHRKNQKPKPKLNKITFKERSTLRLLALEKNTEAIEKYKNIYIKNYDIIE